MIELRDQVDGATRPPLIVTAEQQSTLRAHVRRIAMRVVLPGDDREFLMVLEIDVRAPRRRIADRSRLRTQLGGTNTQRKYRQRRDQLPVPRAACSISFTKRAL